MGLPRPSTAPKPPTQVLEPVDSGPRLKVEGLIWNTFPENVMETGVLKLQGTCQTSVSRTISELTHGHTGPEAIAGILGARNLVIDGLYTLGVTDNLGGACIDDSALAADNSLPIDRNTTKRALPVSLQYLFLRLNQRHHRASLPV